MQEAVGEATDKAVAELARTERQKRAAVLLLIVAAGTVLRTKLAGIILRRRQQARGLAVHRLGVELGAVGVTASAIVLASPGRASDEDAAYADAAAASLAVAWQGMAIASTARDMEATELRRGIDKTRAMIKSRVERTATTEVFAAYNDEHRRSLTDAIERQPALKAAMRDARVARVWDARGDRPCSECWSRNGDILSDTDEGPPMHPRCACIETIDYLPALASAA